MNILYFENIRDAHYPFVRWHLRRGDKIRVFDFNSNLKRRRWLRRLINSGKVERLYVTTYNPESREAIDQTEAIFGRLKEGPAPRQAATLYGSDETDAVFKKLLVREVFKCIYVNRILLREAEQAPAGSSLYFVPEGYYIYKELIDKYGTMTLDPLASYRSFKWDILIPAALAILEKIKWLSAASVFTAVKALSFAVLRPWRRAGQVWDACRYVFEIGPSLLLKFKDGRNLDFLLDGDRINRDNTLFVTYLPLPSAAARGYRAMGYRILHYKEIHGRSTFPLQVIPYWFRMFGHVRGPAFLLRALYVCLRVLIDWCRTFQRRPLTHYLYANDEGVEQIALNILLKRQGCRTISYPLFLGGSFTCAPPEKFGECQNIMWSYLNEDTCVVVNQYAIDFYHLHRRSTARYVPVGFVLSGPVSTAGIDRDRLLTGWFGCSPASATRVISFYDTSFIDADNVITSLDDGAAFYGDILRLLEEQEELWVIVKPAKGDDWFVNPFLQWSTPRGPEMIRLWNRLRSHPRVYWAGAGAENSKVMAASDMVVTHCMSSPTAEALGIRKKAIWYESGTKHLGNLYDDIPGLVAHGYPALTASIDRLLYRTSDRDYGDYLDRYIRGRVEPFLDGRGLDRLRELITT